MATMQTEELKAIAKLGTIGIVKEALKISRTYAKVFLLIQVTLLADEIAVSLVAEYFVMKSLPEPPPSPGSLRLFSVRSHHVHHFSHKPGRLFDSPVIDVLVCIVIWSIFGIIDGVFTGLSLSASTYCVKLYYAGKPASFLDVIRDVVPRVWVRRAVTVMIAVLVNDLIGIAQVASDLLLIPLLIQAHVNPTTVLVVSYGIWLVGLVLTLSLGLIFLVAQTLSVFEEDYGWTAIIKSPKLLKGKLKISMLLQLLLLVPCFITVTLFDPIVLPSVDLSPSTFLLTIVYIFRVSFLLQFITLCYGVQYVSFKAYHESVGISDSNSPEQTEQVGYQRIENRADEPLLSGQGAGNNM